MKTIIRLLFILLFILPQLRSFSQGTEAAKPRMSKNVLKDFIQMHMDYPEKAIRNNEQGNVVISFTVSKEGKATAAKIKESVSPSVDSAALQLFSLILWSPATDYGLPIESQQEFKIKYNIGKYNSWVSKRGYSTINYPDEPLDVSGEIFSITDLDKAPELDLDEEYLNGNDFIGKNLEYPESASKLAIRGEVKLRFVIEQSGLPSNILIIQPVGGGCTEEAIRIVQLTKWFPGIKSGEAVRTCYNLSISFDPADELKSKHIPNQSNSGL